MLALGKDQSMAPASSSAKQLSRFCQGKAIVYSAESETMQVYKVARVPGHLYTPRIHAKDQLVCILVLVWQRIAREGKN